MHDLVARHDVAETDATQRNEAEIAAVQVAPILPSAEYGGSDENVSEKEQKTLWAAGFDNPQLIDAYPIIISKQIIIGTVTVLVSSADSCDDSSRLSENSSEYADIDSDVTVSVSSSEYGSSMLWNNFNLFMKKKKKNIRYAMWLSTYAFHWSSIHGHRPYFPFRSNGSSLGHARTDATQTHLGINPFERFGHYVTCDKVINCLNSMLVTERWEDIPIFDKYSRNSGIPMMA